MNELNDLDRARQGRSAPDPAAAPGGDGRTNPRLSQARHQKTKQIHDSRADPSKSRQEAPGRAQHSNSDNYSPQSQQKRF